MQTIQFLHLTEKFILRFDFADNKKPPRLTTKKRASLKKQAEFEEYFSQHKHRFDMSCDLCPTVFVSYIDARSHYNGLHNIPKGYVKCCGTKLMFRSQIKDHLKRHLDPDSLT